MDRGPLISILEDMKGSDRELSITLIGEQEPLEIRNVIAIDRLTSSNGLRVTTRQNYIWLDATHVSAAWQARSDL